MRNILRFLLSLTFALALIPASAQRYGMEWIKPYQPYYKFCIGQTGLVRIAAQALQNSGAQVLNIAPGRLQVFKNGMEQRVYVSGAQDNQFNATDAIEFWVDRNDGSTDTSLYKPGAQPHRYFSLFTDTSCYFITILPDTTDTTAIVPLRYTSVTVSNPGAFVPEDYFMDEAVVAPAVEYLDGPNMAPGSDLKYVTSDYEDGEGWAGARVGLGQSTTYTLSTPAVYTSGPTATAAIKVIGASDAVRNVNGLNHHFVVAFSNNNASFSTLVDHTTTGYPQSSFTVPISSSSLNPTSWFRLSTINDLGVVSDFNCLSYVKLTYPRVFNWNGATQKTFTLANSKGGIQTRFDITNYGTGSAQSPLIFDITSGQRISGVYNAGTVSVLVPNTGVPHTIRVEDSAAAINITAITPVTFLDNAVLQGAPFVIIHPEQFNQAATNYATYRSQKIPVIKVAVEDLYDQFFFGMKHPLAIRQFMSYLIKAAPVKPKYLLLTGKGYQNDKIRVVVQGISDPGDYYRRNYVPCLGAPSADALFTSAIEDNGAYPEIATGRIPALTNDELQNFLNKLIQYETTPDSLTEWRKHVIHVSGGNDLSEQTAFANQINKNRTLISGRSKGAFVTTFNKNSSSSQQINLRQAIIDAQNQGASMLSFLGHASLTVLDVDIGSITDLRNTGKLPFYYFSGCNVGNVGEVDIPFGIGSGTVYSKDFLCTPDIGGIGWLAHSNFTFDGTLYRMMDAFYNEYCGISYGLPVGDIMMKIGKNFNANDVITRSHVIQWVLQGDPLMVIASPAKPDYQIESKNVFITPRNVTVQEDSFAINIIPFNLGKATLDTLRITVNHRLPDNTLIAYRNLKFKPVFYKDTFSLWLKYADTKKLLGNNQFEVVLDDTGLVQEGNEFNNTAVLSTFIAGSGVSVLLPAKYNIVNGDSVELVAQNNNILITNASYIFELDTTPRFNSFAKRSSGVLEGTGIASYRFALPFADSTAYYWRVRLNLPDNEGGQWDVSSFTHFRNGSTGLAQVRFEQVSDLGNMDQFKLDTTQKTFQFGAIFKGVKAIMQRWDHRGQGVLDPSPSTPGIGSCISSGMVCVLFNGSTLERYSDPDYPANCVRNNAGTIYAYYTFDTRTQGGQTDFANFLQSVKPGDYVAGFSYYYAGAESWSPALRSAISAQGLPKVANASTAFTFMTFIFKKGDVSTALEDTLYDDRGVYIQNVSEFSVSETMLEGKLKAGTVESKLIGAAQSWESCSIQLDSVQVSDSYTLTIKGVKADFSDTVLIRVTNTNEVSLAAIPARTYPFIKVALYAEDTLLRSPVQLKKLIVKFAPTPELTLDPGTGFSFYNTELEQGDSIRMSVSVRNLSESNADSVRVAWVITDANRIERYHATEYIPVLAAKGLLSLSKKISTNELSGQNQLNLTLNDNKRIFENSYLNNFLFKEVTVKTDRQNPLLDVTFDGYRIMNGDIVSPMPVIRITSKDENKYKIQKDTGTFVLMLKRPGNADFERISMDHPNMRFIAGTSASNMATVEYKPEQLPDGTYTLKVLAKDASGNLSGNSSYEVSFTVINESSITHFYPYPNPGTTNIRFVFTLTGSKPPDQLLIRIMTITGKVVKEISAAEFGPIKIGNNVSEYGWDGTDNYGDRLANGVYLYQVITRMNGEEINHRETAADQFISHNIGKIYLMK